MRERDDELHVVRLQHDVVFGLRRVVGGWEWDEVGVRWKERLCRWKERCRRHVMCEDNGWRGTNKRYKLNVATNGRRLTTGDADVVRVLLKEVEVDCLSGEDERSDDGDLDLRLFEAREVWTTLARQVGIYGEPRTCTLK